MKSLITERLRGLCLAALEIVLVLLYVIASMVDLSFLDVWVSWAAMMFFWLVILLFVASLKMFSTHRMLASIGLCMVACFVIKVLFFPDALHRF
jgi:hypothetical protein